MHGSDIKLQQRIIALARHEPGQALALAREFTRQEPRNRRSWATLGYVYEIGKNYEKALNVYRQAMRVAHEEPVSHFDVSRIFIDLESFDDAVFHFSETIRLSRKHEFSYYLSASYFLRAYCFCQLGKFDEALIDLENVPDDSCWWIGGLRTKTELLEACRRGDSTER